MSTQKTSSELIKLIEYMDTTSLDGGFKASILKTAATYYESLAQAESMQTLLMNSINSINNAH